MFFIIADTVYRLSGTVRFDVTGQRKVEAFDVLNLNNDSFVKVNYI